MTNFATFNDFWNYVVSSTGALSPATILQLKAALQQIYDVRGSDLNAAAIIDGLDQPGGATLNFASGPSYSTSVSTKTISIPEPSNVLKAVKTFNMSGQWVEEPLYKVLAHELAHLVLGAKDPAQQLGQPTSAALTLSNTIPDMDLLGGAERAANPISEAISGGAQYTTPSYFVTDAGENNFQQFVAGKSYSYGFQFR